MYVTTADVTDRNGAIDMLKKYNENLSQVQNILVDAGYSGEKFASSVSEILGCTVEVVKRSDMHSFKIIPKRWIVERSFSWLDKCRRLWKNCERYLHTSLQMIVLAFSVLLVHHSLAPARQVLRVDLNMNFLFPSLANAIFTAI